MSRSFKRFLSILLTAAMVLSLGITGWAIDDEIPIVDATKSAREKDERVTAGFEGGTELELKEIDPSELNVPKLGEIEEDDDVLTSEDLPFGLNDIVRVSIVLNDPATMAAGYSVQNIAYNGGAMAYRGALRQQQADVEAAIAAAGVTMNVKWNLTLAVNIISAEVRYADIETIEAVPGVRAVWLENMYEPQADMINTLHTTEYMVGAVQVWNSGYTGAGTKVAIIDTGTNQDHLSFDPEALEYALDVDGLAPDLLTWEDISAVAGELNVAVTQQVYKNTKIPYAYNYIDGGYITDHDSDSQGEHGSHVSGIAAANRYVKINGEFVDAAQEVWAVGVAPDAQILTMKVFGKGGGAYDSDYMSAIEDAIVLGADSVNLSLGSGSPGYTFSNGYQQVMDSLVGSGTVVSISAGNSYNWASFLPSNVPYLYLEDVGLHTGGSPGSFTNSLCVAAAENVGAITTPLFFNDDQVVTFIETLDSEGVPYGNDPISTAAGTYEYVLLDGPGVDDNSHVGQEGDDFMALGREVLEGKVALCYRGSSSFFAKANAAAAQGAAAVIIINNVDGSIRMNLTGYEYSAPVVSILKADGNAILAASEEVTDENGNVYYTGEVEITSEIQPVVITDRDDAYITEFSSWGVPGSLIMKPEITAPGGDIYSVNGMTDDGYEFMSGTSMAAPHITGMAALVGQYIRENNLEEITGQNCRTLINSLLMSTATPMVVENKYLSILQQGSGLGDTFAATQAKSYILMGEDATASWADGKVKVELGQDAARIGEYTFSFSVNNFSDVEMSYILGTDIFTQWITSDGANLLLDTKTQYLGGYYDEYYDFERLTPNLHDVDMDGDTDEDDVQALLDYITGLVDSGELDLDAGEMDGADGISSYDAQLLLEWLDEEGGNDLIVPAHGSVTVTATLIFSEDLKEILDYYFENGAYIEGFTYVVPTTETDDGEILGVIHTIPILGFYGSFTEASMFDCTSPIEAAYGSTKASYTGNPTTNLLTINNGKGSEIFMGNPYLVEDEFPADRLAINPNTKLVNFKYNQIRNAATTGWLAFDENYNVLKSSLGGAALGAWYYVNGQAWQNTATLTTKLNTQVSALGVEEGDVFTIGYFAVPEYYGMMLHPGTTNTSVSADEITELLASGELGSGSYIGYTFKVDAEAPTAEAKLSDDGTKISVTAQDDNYIAFIGIMDVSGNTLFAGEVPEQTQPGEEVEITFDISGLELPNGVAIFVGDYASNEVAYLIVFDPDAPIVATKTVWLLTDKLEAGKDYIISAENAAGTGHVLLDQGTMSYTATGTLDIVTDEIGTYIPVDAVDDAIVWTTLPESSDTAGYSFQSKSSGGYLGYNSTNSPYVSWPSEYASYADSFTYVNNRLVLRDNTSRGMSFNGSSFIYVTRNPSNIYLYTPVTVEIELDPSNVSSVTVSPETATLILGVQPTIELLASVEPIVVADRTVTWSSSDETIATVDQEGVVTAVAPGVATITATSNQTPAVFGTATITVVESEPMDAVVYGQVAFGADDIEYAEIDLNDMSVTDLSNNAMFSAFYGGGRSGDYIYGNDIDNDFHRYNAEDGYAYDEDYHFSIIATWALIDIGCFPGYTIADYTNTTDDNPDPETFDYNFILTGFNATNSLCYFTESGSLRSFDLSDLGSFVAVSFMGAEIDEETELPNFYYFLLTEEGNLLVWIVYPNLSTGGMSAEYINFAHINMLSFGEDKTAYSMSYYETEDVWGVFIADNTTGGIYWVNLDEVEDNEVNAHFVGKIPGATNLSSLSDFNWDTLSTIGTVYVGLTDGGDSVDMPELPAAIRALPRTGVTLHSVEGSYLAEEADFEIIDIEAEDVEIIDVYGGLNAANTAIRRPVVDLDSAVLIDPDYAETGFVTIGITTPGFDPKEIEPEAVPSIGGDTLRSGLFPMADDDAETLYYNGYATLTYDPEALTFEDYDVHPELQITSFSVDEENGIIRFAYASLTPVEEGLIAVVYFEGPSENTVVTVTTEESNDDLDVDESTEIPLELPGFTITIEDYTNGAATCDLDPDATYSHGQEVTFTVAADQAVAVILKEGPFVPRGASDWDDDYHRYTVIDCEDDEEGNHTFTITVEDDKTICLVFKGDVNLNGKVETKDGTMIKRYAVGLGGDNYYDLDNPLKRLVADVDGSGTVESKDGSMIARQVVGTYEIAW